MNTEDFLTFFEKHFFIRTKYLIFVILILNNKYMNSFNPTLTSTMENPEIILLGRQHSLNFLNIWENFFWEFFDENQEEDPDGNCFIRFKKIKSYPCDGKTISIYQMIKHQDYFLIKSDESLFVMNVCESDQPLEKDGKLLFYGWDSNVTIDMKTMDFKEVFTR